jgi:hypothetical protein
MAFRNVTLRNSQQRAASTFMVEYLLYYINETCSRFRRNDSVYQTTPYRIRDGQLRNKHCNKLRSQSLHLRT